MVTKRRRITIWDCRCERCGYEWEAQGDEAPAACARCKNRGWNIPRGSVKPGPKPKARRG